MVVSRTVLIALLVTLFIAFLTHSWGLFDYPYYEGDEGAYTSQAWSLVNDGQLSPYGYWYDHPPFGWIVMAGWTLLFGGNFFVFGDSSIDMMRVMMLLTHVASAFLVFFITHRLSKNTAVAVFATLFYTVSPLFIYYQRRVLLDNLMTFWLLLSLAALLLEPLRLRRIIFSGVFFACALLTKIPAVVFVPAFLYVIVQKDVARAALSEKLRSVALWLFSVFCIGMIFIGWTIMKGEFLPASVTGGEHVSFISGITFQLDRDSAFPFWHPESSFRIALGDWIFKDPFIVILSTVGLIIGVFGLVKNISLRIIMFFALLFLVFLMRGGIVTNFHILPLVPFVSIACALSFWWAVERIFAKSDTRLYAYGIFGFVLLLVFSVQSKKEHYVRDETSNYNNAIIWIKQNVDSDKSIVMDAQGLVDLWDPRHVNDKTFPGADWFSKVVHDRFTRDIKLDGTWENIDYVLSSHEQLRQFGALGDDNIAKRAYLNSAPIKDWTGGAGHVQEERYHSVIGDWAKLYSVGDESSAQAENQWRAYKQKHLESYGQVVDGDDITRSRDQAYAMLRSVWSHDQATFDGLWQWTKDHFQHRGTDKLLSRAWQGDVQLASQNDTYADSTIAAALILASSQWNQTRYQDAAREIISSLWEQSVVHIEGKYFMLPADKWVEDESLAHYLYDPAVITPAWYRLFATIDTEHPWEELVAHSYASLEAMTDRTSESAGFSLPIVKIDRTSGESAIADADSRTAASHERAQNQSYRTLWHVGLDERWSGSVDAKKYLTGLDAALIVEKSDRFTVEHAGILTVLSYGDQVISDAYYAKFFDAQDLSQSNSVDHEVVHWMWVGKGFYAKSLEIPQY